MRLAAVFAFLVAIAFLNQHALDRLCADEYFPLSHVHALPLPNLLLDASGLPTDDEADEGKAEYEYEANSD
jgi:hypothetical protein